MDDDRGTRHLGKIECRNDVQKNLHEIVLDDDPRAKDGSDVACRLTKSDMGEGLVNDA